MATGNSLSIDTHVHEIYDMVLTTRKCKILSEVIKLGLFNKIEEMDCSVTADSLAKKMSYRTDFTERLLNGLVCYKYLDKRQDINGGDDVYSLTEMTSRYLTTKTGNLTPRVLFETDVYSDSFEKLPLLLKSKTNNQYYKHLISNEEEEGIPSKPEKIKPTPASFMSLMVAKQHVMAKQFVHSHDFSMYTSILDVGGGAGYIAHEFKKTYPQMKCMVFDLSTVVDTALLQYPEMGQHVTYVKGDFFADELPKSDIILLSHILHNWLPEKCDNILRNVYQSLTPGGCILVGESCLNEDKVGPFSTIGLDLLMMTTWEGKERSFNEWSELLQKHGFNDVSVKYIDKYIQDLIIAFKPV